MAEQIKDGGPAFPVQYSNEADGPAVMPTPGMTLRDYFAAHALSGIVTKRPSLSGNDANMCAQEAYALADHMLAERERGR